MPTYRLGPNTQAGDPPARRLSCAWCLQAIGEVRAATRHQSMSAARVVARWPELREAVGRHETDCRVPGR